MVLIYGFPIAISSLLMAAHLFRNGLVVLAGISLLVPFLLFLKRKWVPSVLTFYLLLSSVEWLRALVILVNHYKEQGDSYTRLVLILTAVILFNLLSILVLRINVMKRRYGGTEDEIIIRSYSNG